MNELLRTILLCGVLSGTQPLTLMGLLLVMTGGSPRRTGSAFIAGAFTVETTILVVASAVVGGTVEVDSGPGRTLFGVRLALGVLLVLGGLFLRRPPRKPAPEVPAALARLDGMPPRRAFVAGMLLADYQGPFVAAMALAAADISAGARLSAIIPYTLIATGVPVAVLLLSTRSAETREKFLRRSQWVVANRRQIASWFAIVMGLLLIGDATIGLLLT